MQQEQHGRKAQQVRRHRERGGAIVSAQAPE